MEADDLFKDYFETLNPDEVLADPVCEDEQDPLGLGADFQFESLETNPDDLLTPISNLGNDHNNGAVQTNPDDPGPSNRVMNIIKQELDDEVPPAPVKEGLKIASFAVDPDVCSVVDPGTTDHQPNINLEHFTQQTIHPELNQLQQQQHSIQPQQQEIKIYQPSSGIIRSSVQEWNQPTAQQQSTTPTLQFLLRNPAQNKQNPHQPQSSAVNMSDQLVPVQNHGMTKIVHVHSNRGTTAKHSAPAAGLTTTRVRAIVPSVPQQTWQLHLPHYVTQKRKIFMFQKPTDKLNNVANLQEFYIFTGETKTHSNKEWKLFVPAERISQVSQTVSQHGNHHHLLMKEVQQKHSSKQYFLLCSLYDNEANLFIADHAKNSTEFAKMFAARNIFLTTADSEANNQIPQDFLFCFKEAPFIKFKRSILPAGVGLEATESRLEDHDSCMSQGEIQNVINQRKSVRRTIFKHLRDVYKVRQKTHGTDYDETLVERAAALMESDLVHQLKDVKKVVQVISDLCLQNYVNRLNLSINYHSLFSYPDIHYLALTKPHFKISQPSSVSPTSSIVPATSPSVPATSSNNLPQQSSGAQMKRTIIQELKRTQSQEKITFTINPLVSPSNISSTPNFLQSQPLPIISSVSSISASSPDAPPPPAQQHEVEDNPTAAHNSKEQHQGVIPGSSNKTMLVGSKSRSNIQDIKFLCPFTRIGKCDESVKHNRLFLINHLSLSHYQDKLVTSLASRRSQSKISNPSQCPVPRCGYASHNMQDLVLHYGNTHNTTVQMLQREGLNLRDLLDSGFQFLTPSQQQFAECPVCKETIAKSNLTYHLAVLHLMEEYMASMAEQTGWARAREAGQCPQCPFTYGFGEAPTPAVARTRDILLVKHYATIHLPPASILKSKSTAVNSSQQPSTSRTVVENKNLPALRPDKFTIICRSCKRQVAEVKGKSVKLKDCRKLRCKSDEDMVTCWLCNKNILFDNSSSSTSHARIVKFSQVAEKHLREDDHVQKETMLHLLTEVYGRARGFSLEAGYLPNNYKFFILALKAFAVHNEGITVMNCLSLLMSILDISMKQYSDLYNHVDKLADQPIPNYLCYCCNYAEYGRVTGLTLHLQSSEHQASVTRLVRAGDWNEYLYCSGCGSMFNQENMMSHAAHILRVDDEEKQEEEHAAAEPDPKKRKLDDDEYEEVIEDASDHDSVQDPNFDESNVEPNVEPDEEFHSDDDNANDDDHEPKKQDDPNNTNQDSPSAATIDDVDDVQYYYFCLDCEDQNATGLYSLDHSRYPISINIGQHIEKTNHMNFVPIKNQAHIRLKNISFNPEYHKTVIKSWKQLVKDGEITDVDYSQSRKCIKCNLSFNDAIDMFKHIKDKHVHKI